MQEDKYITCREAKKILNISDTGLRQLIQNNVFNVTQCQGVTLIERISLYKYRDNKQTTNPHTVVTKKQYVTKTSLKKQKNSTPVTHTIIKSFGSIGKKEFNYVRWDGDHGTFEKYDIRFWTKDGTAGKGITLSQNDVYFIATLSVDNIKSLYASNIVRIQLAKATIYENIAILPQQDNQKWNCEVNVIDWGYGKGKQIDIRSWSPDHVHSGKSRVTFSLDEFIKLINMSRTI